MYEREHLNGLSSTVVCEEDEVDYKDSLLGLQGRAVRPRPIFMTSTMEGRHVTSSRYCEVDELNLWAYYITIRHVDICSPLHSRHVISICEIGTENTKTASNYSLKASLPYHSEKRYVYL